MALGQCWKSSKEKKKKGWNVYIYFIFSIPPLCSLFLNGKIRIIKYYCIHGNYTSMMKHGKQKIAVKLLLFDLMLVILFCFQEEKIGQIVNIVCNQLQHQN